MVKQVFHQIHTLILDLINIKNHLVVHNLEHKMLNKKYKN